MTNNTSIRRAGHSNLLIGGIASIAIAAMLFTVVVFGKEIRDIHSTSLHTNQAAATAKTAADTANRAINDLQDALRCQDRYEKAQRARSVRLVKVSRAQNNAQAWVLLAANARNTHRLIRALHAYAAAHRRYNRALRNNPAPPLPKFLCAKKAEQRAKRQHHSTPKPAPKPSPSPSVTTRYVHIPSPTVTRIQTQTRTVTRTVTVPPGQRKGNR